MEYDASGVAVMVASEAHAITLAIEGLLGVVFTVATLTDEAIDAGEVRQISSFRHSACYGRGFVQPYVSDSLLTCTVRVT